MEPPSRTEVSSEQLQTARAALVSWRRDLHLSQAASHARDGDFLSAEAFLSSIDDMTRSAACLDLLARIRAQQGRLAEARTLWIAASELEPDNMVHGATARRVEAWQRLPIGPERLRLLAFVAAAALLVFVMWGLGRRPSVVLTSETAPSGQGAGGRPTPLNRPQGPSATVGNGSARAVAAGQTQSAIRVPGTVVKDEGDAAVVLFKEGLFGSEAMLTPAAERILDELGRALSGSSEGLVITVTGHTDDGPLPVRGRFADNVSLGLARAVAVAEQLRRAGRLAPETLVVRSLGSAEPPFPNSSRNGRLRNRTVVIRISHSNEGR